MKILTLTEESKTDILENLLKRSPNSYGKFESQVAEIIENVRAKKDAALFDEGAFHTLNIDQFF